MREVGVNVVEYFRKKVGNGEGTKFWEDRWLESGYLKERFKRLFHLESDKGVTVADRRVFREGGWVWNWNWRREPRGREVGEFEVLMREIDGFTPLSGESDRLLWSLNPQ